MPPPTRRRARARGSVATLVASFKTQDALFEKTARPVMSRVSLFHSRASLRRAIPGADAPLRAAAALPRAYASARFLDSASLCARSASSIAIICASLCADPREAKSRNTSSRLACPTAYPSIADRLPISRVARFFSSASRTLGKSADAGSSHVRDVAVSTPAAVPPGWHRFDAPTPGSSSSNEQTSNFAPNALHERFDANKGPIGRDEFDALMKRLRVEDA